jgi:alpha-1,3-rhamnosyl/mannosyltransferase
MVAARLKKRGFPARYLLFVGTIEPRKNLLPLLRAYCGLPEPLRRQWPLLLVGSWGWNAKDVADFLDRTGRACGVRHVGYLADRDLPFVYNGARALLYPSRYEGFGLPPLEMMACGGAVLAATAGALIETIGQRACLIHPDDTDGWRHALHRVVTDDDWWNSLRDGVEAVARPYTWERCAAETLRVYRSVCGRPRLPLLRAAG